MFLRVCKPSIQFHQKKPGLPGLSLYDTLETPRSGVGECDLEVDRCLVGTNLHVILQLSALLFGYGVLCSAIDT
jgi:hypothetical protein